MNLDIKKIDAVILCGGMGERLKSLVKDRPKPMAEINGRPFLDFLIDYLSGSGLKRFILSAGYKAEVIIDYYSNIFKNSDRDILFSRENTPLGTAGAIKNSRGLIQSNPFFVVNGDSICKLNFNGFLDFHSGKKAIASVALTVSEDKKRFGSVRLNTDNMVIGFDEKSGDKKSGNLINAGVYIFDKSVLDSIPEGTPYSLEYDLFNKLNGFYGYITDKPFIDIGTPEGYQQAQEIL